MDAAGGGSAARAEWCRITRSSSSVSLTQSANVTLLLRQLRSGDPATRNQLTELIYPALRRIAGRQFRAERTGHTLQPTALVNEAYVRLVAHEEQTWRSRTHFFGAAAEVMRRILIDHARACRAGKRGGGQAMASIEDVTSATEGPSVDLLALDVALAELATISPRQSRIVELRYFGGLSVPETAEALGLNSRTVDRDWAAAKAWLRLRLRP
jgi:RNA polymerase sigma factor (TIGR02999 family)